MKVQIRPRGPSNVRLKFLPGIQGFEGWSPVFSIVVDGLRRVLQLTDWVGGRGIKPATESYVGSSGLVADIASAVDIRGPQGIQGIQGIQGPPNTLGIGTVTTGAAGSSASATITGTSPNQTLNLTIPRGNTGLTGPSNTLAIGTVSTGAAGSSASATITGTSPNQTLNLTIPKGDTGSTGPANTLAIGTVTTGAAGSAASATITGTAPNQTLNLTIPKGQDGTGLTDGDKGDITVSGSGTSFTIDPSAVTTTKIQDGAVTNAKLANVATSTFKGRASAGSGAPEDLTVSQAQTLIGGSRYFISAADITSGAALQDITLPSGYEFFEITFTSLVMATATFARLQGANSGGLITTANYLETLEYVSAANAKAVATRTGVSFWQLSQVIPTAFSGFFKLFLYPGAAASYPHMHIRGVDYLSTPNAVDSYDNSGMINVFGRLTSLRLTASTGNLGGGRIIVEGMKTV